MIPSVVASQVRRGIEDSPRTPYPSPHPFFQEILDRLFHDSEALFEGLC